MSKHDSASRPFRVGLIGCGSVALAAHIPALLQLGDDFRVVAIADPTESLRRRAQELLEIGSADAYASHEELLTRDDIDVVDVCTPPNVRPKIVIDAAAAQKQIISEKPLATAPKLAREMVRATRAAGVTLGLMHNYLYLSEFVAARSFINAGEIGVPEVAILNYLGVIDNPGSSEFQPGWRRRPTVAGGGVLMDMLHVVYVAEHLLGEPICRVSAYIDARENDAPVEELALCRFETESKAALVNIGWGAGPGGIQVSGSEGRLVIHYEQDGTSPFFPAESIRVVGSAGEHVLRELDSRRTDHVLALAAFARSLRAGTDPDATGEDGQRTLEAVLAAYESAVAGRVISLPLTDDDPVFANGTSGLRDVSVSPTSHAARRGVFGVAADGEPPGAASAARS